jgi:hypothetical protein
MHDLRQKLLWVDCLGGLAVGVLVLALSGWLSDLYRLPLDLVRFMGWVNLGYGAYSLSLASRAVRPLPLIVLLAVANMGWAVFFCFRWAFDFWGTASVFGLLQLVGEGIFVGALGCLELRWRESLRGAD